MKLHERLAALVSALPDDARITITGGMIREWIAEEGDEAKPAAERDAPDRLLTALEVADVLGTDVRYVYRHADSWDFTRRLSSGTLRFSEKGLQTWIERTAA